MTSPLSLMATLAAAMPARHAGDGAGTPPSPGEASGGAGEFALALQRHSGGLGAEAGATLGRQRSAAASRAAAERPSAKTPSADAPGTGESRIDRHVARQGGAGESRPQPASVPATPVAPGSAGDGRYDAGERLAAAPDAGDDDSGATADALSANAALLATPVWPTWLPMVPAGGVGASGNATLVDASAVGGVADPSAGGTAIDAFATRPLPDAGLVDRLPADVAPLVTPVWPIRLPMAQAGAAAVDGHADTAAGIAGGVGAPGHATLADAPAVGGGADLAAGGTSIDAAAARSTSDAGPAGRLAAMRLAAAGGGADRAVNPPIGHDIPREISPHGADADADAMRGRGGQDLAAAGRLGTAPRPDAPDAPNALNAAVIGISPADPAAGSDPAMPIDEGRFRGALPLGRPDTGEGRSASMPGDEVARVGGTTDGGRLRSTAVDRADAPPAAAGIRREPPGAADVREPLASASTGEHRPAAAPETVSAPRVEPGSPAAPALPAFAVPMAASAPLAATTVAAANMPMQARIDVAIDQPGFAPALGVHLSLMARDGVQQARLQLHPAEMGPIDVQIAIDGSAARIDFHAAVAATREAIEASLPALAGALRESGLTLAGGGVFQQAPGQQQSPGQAASGSRHGGSGTRDPADADRRADTTAGRSLQRRGLVDLMA